MTKRKSSRGLRNCNPGNIRRSATKYLGEVAPSCDIAFKQFESMAWGYRAMFVLLDSYARKKKLRTIRTMIERYAPSFENHTQVYIDTVSRLSGIGCDEVIDTRSHDHMVPIVAAMSRVENGVDANMSEVEQGWTLYMQHKA